MKYQPTNTEIHQTEIYKRAKETADLIQTPEHSPKVKMWLELVDAYREACRDLNSTYSNRFETTKITSPDFQENLITFQTIQGDLDRALALHASLSQKMDLAKQYEEEWQRAWDINMARQDITANAYQVARAWLIEQHKAETKKTKTSK